MINQTKYKHFSTNFYRHEGWKLEESGKDGNDYLRIVVYHGDEKTR